MNTNPLRITTIKHPVVEQFLAARDNPSSSGFLIEGLNFIIDIDEDNLKYLFLDEDISEDAEIKNRFSDDKVFYVSLHVMKKLSDTVNVQKAIALVEKKNVLKTNKYVLLNGVQDPGNVGTIIRNAAAFGFNVILDRKCANPYKEKVIRSSAGAVLRVHVELEDSLEAIIQRLIANGFRVATAELDTSAKEIDDFEKEEKIAIVFGNESKGIDKQVSDCVNNKLYIPINRNKIDSLNVAAAASIIMYKFQ